MKTRILMLLASAAAFAQQPFLPNVAALPGSPSRVLYGTYKGAFVRSADGGTTWTPVYVTEPGLPQPPVVSIITDVIDSNTVFLATTAAAGGVWRSTDAGLTWTQVNNGLPTAGGPVLDFRETTGSPVALYGRVGNQLFRSVDRGGSWTFQGPTPGASGALAIADPPANVMYFVDAISLTVYASLDFGHSWIQNGALPVPLAPGQTVVFASVLSSAATNLFVSVSTPGIGAAPYLSTNSGGSFTDQTSVGLGLFSKIDSGVGGPVYATAYGSTGFYRSDDNGQSWKSIGVIGLPYTLGAVDPGLRTTIYAVRGGATPALVRSADSGTNWTALNSTITPTLAKPAAAINAVLEENAPYSQAFTVRAYEDASWPMSVTLTTSGEPWLQLGSTGGTTPLANSVSISSVGLAPGTYTASIKISAPQSFNQSVTIPVTLTVRPAGSLGPQYSVTSAAGNGSAGGSATSGAATSTAIGSAKALAVDSSGRLLISASNRIWQLSNGTVTAIAGSGVFGSTGDGGDILQASLADPDGITIDPQGTIYFAEYSTGRVRKILNGAISTVLDLPRLNVQTGTHSVLIDSFGRLVIALPAGLYRFDGSRLQVITPYAMSDPYSMVADSAGNIYVSDRGAHQILKFPAGGAVSVYAGTGSAGFGGDGGVAASAMLNTPSGLAIDSHGTIFVADTGNQRIRSITSDGVIRTVAGSGVRGFAGDNSTADFAAFQNPAATAVDANGNVFIADAGNNRVRKLTLAVAPTPLPSAVVNAYSGSLQLAPGGAFSVYGDLLSQVEAQATTATWPRSLAGVAVTINGIAAPLYYVSKGLINGQVPFEITPGPATVVVTVNGSIPAQINAQVVAANPGLLLYQGRALAVNVKDVSVNSPSSPAVPGDFVILFITGTGVPDHPVQSGAPAPSAEPFARVAYPYTITVGNQPVTVPFFGLAPGFVGLAQANIFIPDLPSGDYPVVVTVNGVASNSGNISIRR